MLASHNTFSYASVRQWWLKPFAAFARCQDHDLLTQYTLGARIVDLRLRVSTDLNISVAHGLCTYNIDIIRTLDNLVNSSQYRSDTQPLYIRVICEDSRNHTEFSTVCDMLAKRYPTIRFCGGQSKKTWEIAHTFPDTLPPFIDRYGSWGHRNRLHNLLWSIYPRLWARLHNHSFIDRAKDPSQPYIFLDFIGTYPSDYTTNDCLAGTTKTACANSAERPTRNDTRPRRLTRLLLDTTNMPYRPSQTHSGSNNPPGI